MKRRVLVIEDDPDVGRLITLQLAELDCESRLVDDGVTGLAAAEEGRWDLVILDLTLPRMDGLQICRRLRAAEVQTAILMGGKEPLLYFQRSYRALGLWPEDQVCGW